MAKIQRLLIKLSGEAFKNNSDSNFDYVFMKKLAEKVKFLIEKKWMSVVIVSGGGNIFRWGQDSKWFIAEATWHYMGMMATLMNGVAFGDVLEKAGQSVRVMSAIEAPRVVPTFNRKKALRHLDMNSVVIGTAGTGNPFFTFFFAAVIRALELDCDVMIKATKVDGVYDKDPNKYDDATKFDTIAHSDAYQRGLNIMDHSAIAMAMDNKLPIFVCKVESIDQFGDDEAVGSRVKS